MPVCLQRNILCSGISREEVKSKSYSIATTKKVSSLRLNLFHIMYIYQYYSPWCCQAAGKCHFSIIQGLYPSLKIMSGFLLYSTHANSGCLIKNALSILFTTAGKCCFFKNPILNVGLIHKSIRTALISSGSLIKVCGKGIIWQTKAHY